MAVFFNRFSVLPDGQTASVETSEIWFQPLAEVRDGKEVPLAPEKYPEHHEINLYTRVQFYLLEKRDGQWCINSNPAPASP